MIPEGDSTQPYIPTPEQMAELRQAANSRYGFEVFPEPAVVMSHDDKPSLVVDDFAIRSYNEAWACREYACLSDKPKHDVLNKLWASRKCTFTKPNVFGRYKEVFEDDKGI